MFFVVSKLYWMLASPVTLLLIVGLVGALLSFGRYARIGRVVALCAIGTLTALSLFPIGDLLVAPLENRFPQPPVELPAPYGIIVLGGAISPALTKDRGQVVFDDGERVAEAVILARRYPNAKLLFSGGNGSLLSSESLEASEAKQFWIDLGIDPARILLEDKSRNTDENARFSAALVHPEPAQRWLLVTSGFHMPRSVGLFEKAGFTVIPYPVAFHTLRSGHGIDWDTDPARNLRAFEVVAKEYIGLMVYRLTGRIDRLFPGPLDYPSNVALYSDDGAPSR